MPGPSVQRVEQLAPDPGSLRAARGLARASRWQGLGRDERAAWGECQGSGARPYQVRVDLAELTSGCSCPSRKVPCKHALGLLLMLAGDAAAPHADPPAFVQEWLADRARRAERKEAAAALGGAPDAEAQAKRVQRREARIEAGLAELEMWIADLVAGGFAAARARPAATWSHMAARLVDAQAPGLARRVRDVGACITAPEWSERTLAALARLQLLVDAYRRLQRLPPDLAAEVRARVGWTQRIEAVLEREGIRDRWQVAATRETDDEELKTRFTWVIGHASAHHGLILEFAPGEQPLPDSFEPGQQFDGELVFFDGAPPHRGVVKRRNEVTGRVHTLPFAAGILAIQDRFASALAVNPWLERLPAVLGPVSVTMEAGLCALIDEDGRRVPVATSFRHGWHLLSLSRGAALVLFGEWNGHSFFPLSVSSGGALFSPVTLGFMPVLARAS